MSKVDIIAEIGINHGGDLNKAMLMVDAAKASGVHLVKFQHYDALKLLGKDSPYLEYAAKCQFTKAQHEHLKSYCDVMGMEYMCSVFDIADVPWVDKLVKRHKVASRMNTNVEFMRALIETEKELIVSVQNPATQSPAPHIRLMYCITKYPTPEKELQDLPCNKNMGLSSHCPSIKPSLLAVAQGANLLEHHVTFSREEEGCDMSSSITFEELHQLNLWANKYEVV